MTAESSPADQQHQRVIYDIRDYTPSTQMEPFAQPGTYSPDVPIAIDLGTHSTRIGLTTSKDPAHTYPTLVAKYRDRKLQQTLTFIGNDVFLDPTIKSQAKSPFDGSILTNWDHAESMFDYAFHHLGVNTQGSVQNPIVLTERPGMPLLQRRSFYELLYETYSVDKVALGIDSLFSFHANGGTDGVVIGTGHEATHVIPVIEGKALMPEAKRINWGGRQATDYMSSLLQLKYPFFPTKLNTTQVDNIVKDWCYISKDYQEELRTAMDLDKLGKLDITLEAPFTEAEKVQKTDEELAILAEKRKEQGRRLQEQAQQKRLEKLIQKEQEFEYFTSLQERLSTMSKKNKQAAFKEEGFANEEEFNKHLTDLTNAVKRARKQDIGDDTPLEPPSFPLLDTPDEELTPEELKDKKKQRMLKAAHDARIRAKQEKEAHQQQLAKEAQEDADWRARDLKGWIHDRRSRLSAIITARKDRAKLKEQLSNRKSVAAQMRMKNIASLASENSNGKRRRGGNIDNDPTDTFGANDDDWGIYRDIANVDDEEFLEEEEAQLVALEKELLEHDPSFTQEDTLEASFDFRKSVLHKFYRGEGAFDSEDSHQLHQIHINIERIRVPEVLFQPSIAGLDQAGIPEISQQLLLNNLKANGALGKHGDKSTGFSGDADAFPLAKDIFVAGGLAKYPNFSTRLHSEFLSFLPVGTPLNVRLANDPLNDAWRGMASWAEKQKEIGYSGFVTRKEYDEMGPDYLKEHGLGNNAVLRE